MGYTKLNLFYEALNAFGKEYAMADTKNELINEEDQGMLITLEDENGQEVEFEFLDVIEFEGTEYIVLIENDEDADEVVILQIIRLTKKQRSMSALTMKILLTRYLSFSKRNMRATLTLNNSFQIELPMGGSFLLCEYNILSGKKYR